MFVGWIRRGTFQQDLEDFGEKQVCDKNLILNTANENKNLAFGAYEDKTLVAFITAYVMDKMITINNFYYLDSVGLDIKSRLLKILLNNLYEDKKPIVFMIKKDELELVKKSGFEVYADFKKAVYSGQTVAFNFTNATAKSISNENYLPVMRKVEMVCFEENEERLHYVSEKVFKSSSLVFSTDFGYQHSYALNKSIIKISPWIMDDMAYDDAQKLIRGVLYHRGLKKIIAFIPDIEDIVNLYKSYKFEIEDGYFLMYKNEKPSMKLDMIYAY